MDEALFEIVFSIVGLSKSRNGIYSTGVVRKKKREEEEEKEQKGKKRGRKEMQDEKKEQKIPY
jgi:hypothetical protein